MGLEDNDDDDMMSATAGWFSEYSAKVDFGAVAGSKEHVQALFEVCKNLTDSTSVVTAKRLQGDPWVCLNVRACSFPATIFFDPLLTHLHPAMQVTSEFLRDLKGL